MAQIGAITSAEAKRQKDLLVQLVTDFAWKLGMSTGAVAKETGEVQHFLRLPGVGVVSWLISKENSHGAPLAWFDEVSEISADTWDNMQDYLDGKKSKKGVEGGDHAEGSAELQIDKVLSKQGKEASETEETREPIERSTLPNPALQDKESGGGVEKAILEDGVGSCVCKECGYSAVHTKGAACVDKVCPDCGAPLEGSRAKPKSWRDKFSQLWSSLGQILTKELAPKSEAAEDESRFFTTKQADGRYRWMSISSTAFLDREFDIVASKALERSADSVVRDRGPLRFWHVKGVDFGDCDFALYDGLCLIESGLWYDDEVSQAARKETKEHPQNWRVSIAFLADPTDRDRNVDVKGRRVNNIYYNIAILERSILPARVSANAFSQITTEGDSEMQAHKIAVLREMLGPELAEVAIAQADGINAKSAEPDAIFKEVSNEVISNKFKEMAEVEEDPELKSYLEKAAEIIFAAPAPEEKEAPEPDPNDLFVKAMGDLPDCELKEAFLALAEKAKKKVNDEDDDEKDEDTDVTEQSKEGTSEPSDHTPEGGEEALIELVKTMSDRLTVVSLEVAALRGSQSTRASMNRPSANPGNVDPAATVAAKEKADQESIGEGVVQDMGDALMNTFLGGGNDNG